MRDMNEGSCSGLPGAFGQHPSALVVDVVKGEVLGFKLPANHVDDDVGVLHGLHQRSLVLQVELGEQNLKQRASY